MNRAHDTGLDRSKVVESLSHRSEAVRGAGSCGDDGVILRQRLVVNVVNDGRKIISSRSGNNNLLSAGIDVCLCLCLGCIKAGALENYVYIELTPRAIVCIGLFINLDRLALNGDGTFLIVSGYGILLTETDVTTLRRVILQKVSEHGRGRKVVDCNDLISFRTKHLSESQTTDTSKTIDSYFYCHDFVPPVNFIFRLFVVSKNP